MGTELKKIDFTLSEAVLNKIDFTLSIDDMCAAHGVSSNSINKWSKEGAFPHAIKNKQSKNISRIFHKDCAGMNGGEIKKNRKENKYQVPFFYQRDEKSPQQKSANNHDILNTLDAMNKKMDFIINELTGVKQ